MESPRDPSPDSEFRSTRWSVVARAGHKGARDDRGRDHREREMRDALGWLFQAYSYPLYAYARRRGSSPQDAEEAVADFFAKALESGSLAGADRARGRFRQYLLGAFEHALSNRRRSWRALKRGGGREHVSLDAETAEKRYALEPVDARDPQRVFEAAWARAVIERAFAALREEYAARGDGALFDRLRAHLIEDAGDDTYARLAAELGTNEGALKVAVHRLRKRFRAALEAEIAETVEQQGDVQDEIRHLFEALGH